MGLLNPIGLAITAIAGAGYLIYNNWDFLKQKAGAIWKSIVNAIKHPFDAFFDWVDGKFKTVIGVYKELKALIGITDKVGLETNQTAKQRQEEKGIGKALQTTPINSVNYDPSKKMGLTSTTLSLKESLGIAGMPVTSPSIETEQYMQKLRQQGMIAPTNQNITNNVTINNTGGEIDQHEFDRAFKTKMRNDAHTDQDTQFEDVAS